MFLLDVLVQLQLQKDAALDTLGKTAAPNACIHILGEIAGNDVIVTKTCVMFLRDVLRTQQIQCHRIVILGTLERTVGENVPILTMAKNVKVNVTVTKRDVMFL